MSVMKSKQLRKALAFLIVFSMIFVATATGFATTNCVESQADSSGDKGIITTYDPMNSTADEKADIVEAIVGTDDINTDIQEDKDTFNVSEENDLLEVNKDGDAGIAIISSPDDNQQEEVIEIGLPDIADNTEGEITENGTIVFDSKEEAFVSVQALQEKQGGEDFLAVRTMVTITDETAPGKYEYDYNLPKGYYLAFDYDVDNELDMYDCGYVYVMTDDNVISSVIEPAWAVDAEGRSVNTEYILQGNTLIQTVEFNETSAFPIVADPKNVSKTKTKKYTYFNTKEGRKKLISLRKKINKQQKNIWGVINALTAIASFKWSVLGIPATALSVATGKKAKFLEKCEDKVTAAHEGLSSHPKAYKSVTFTEKYKGVFVKHAKQTVWTAQVPTYNYNKK